MLLKLFFKELDERGETDLENSKKFIFLSNYYFINYPKSNIYNKLNENITKWFNASFVGRNKDFYSKNLK